jgi:hypothetical protein
VGSALFTGRWYWTVLARRESVGHTEGPELPGSRDFLRDTGALSRGLGLGGQ